MLIFSTIAITLALVFYTIGAWSVRKEKTLKKWHVIIFWLGVVFDLTGTFLMQRMAKAGTANVSALSSTIHSVTGLLGIILMVINAIWASRVLVNNDAVKKQIFLKFSLIVWILWLIPYFIGAAVGMMQ